MRNRSTRLSVNSDSPLVHAADITKSPVSIPRWDLSVECRPNVCVLHQRVGMSERRFGDRHLLESSPTRN